MFCALNFAEHGTAFDAFERRARYAEVATQAALFLEVREG
jgi:hypothetical protein